MAVIAPLLALAFVSLPAVQAGGPGFVRWSAAELEARNAALSEAIRPDGSARETLADYEVGGSHRFRFIRREADGFPEQHAHIEDVVLIQSGAATLVVGGELVDRNGGDGEYRGTDIAGGVHYPVARGDIAHIPADTPHRYLVPEGGHVTYVLVRLPALAGERVLPPDAPALDFEPPGFALWKARELDRRRADLDRRIGPDRSARETLADYGSPTRSHRFRHIHRDADGVPEIHDDIIDETDVRREQVAVHKRFGTQMAVLIGDVLYAQFFTVIARLPVSDQVRVALFERFCSVTRDMCLGEMVQQGALRGELPAREGLYHDVIDSKTAGLMSGCCYGGALVAGSAAERAAAYARFGRAFGIVFQLIDDYLDGDAVYGDRAALPGRARMSADDARAELDGFEPGTATEHLASLLRYTLARPRHEVVA
jgi:mannose-6-phosphate isomerase-like protein (cupin superfamily)